MCFIPTCYLDLFTNIQLAPHGNILVYSSVYFTEQERIHGVLVTHCSLALCSFTGLEELVMSTIQDCVSNCFNLPGPVQLYVLTTVGTYWSLPDGPFSSVADQPDLTMCIQTPGLTGEAGTVSFVTSRGRYLHIETQQAGFNDIEQEPPTDTRPFFAEQATFRIEPALFGGGYLSFRSVWDQRPDYYICNPRREGDDYLKVGQIDDADRIAEVAFMLVEAE